MDVVVGREISKSFPASQVLERSEAVTCPWMDGRHVSNSSFCHLEVGEDTHLLPTRGSWAETCKADA